MILKTQRSTQEDYTDTHFKCNYFFQFFSSTNKGISRAILRHQSGEHPCHSLTLFLFLRQKSFPKKISCAILPLSTLRSHSW